MTTVTKTYRRTSYAAIDPTQPANAQADRVVLVTGATSGIGYATAKAFLLAGARTVVITGRDEERLQAAVRELEAAAAKGKEVVGLKCDVGVGSEVERLWRSLTERRVVVDTLILNAGALSSQADKEKPVVEEIWRKFEINVLGGLRMIEGFQRQGPEDGRGRVVVNLTTARAHGNPQPVHDGYGPSKVAMVKAMEALDDECVKEKRDMRVVNVNPGIVRTEAALRFMTVDEKWMFDAVELPAHFIVWVTTQPAEFLRGRFLWANWDVEELMGMRERFEKEPGFLRIGLNGVENLDPRAFMMELKQMAP